MPIASAQMLARDLDRVLALLGSSPHHSHGSLFPGLREGGAALDVLAQIKRDVDQGISALAAGSSVSALDRFRRARDTWKAATVGDD